MIALSQIAVVSPPLFPKAMTMAGKMLTFLLALTAAASASAAPAQDDPDTLAVASQQVDSGVALARRQMAARDLLGALGTLERVLFAHPEAVPPRLLYASLLCRVDDAEGAGVELNLLAGNPIADADWAEVTAACGPMPRPVPTGRGSRR
jgi:hypothetical protein